MSNQFEKPRSGDKRLKTTHQKSNREGSWEPQRYATNLSDQSLAASQSPIDQISKLYRTWADKPSSKEGDQIPSKRSSSSSDRWSFSFKRAMLLGTIGALSMVSRAEAAVIPENHHPGSTKSTSILGEITEKTFATSAAFAQAFPTLAKDLVGEPQSTVTETVTVPGPTETVHAEQSEINSAFKNGATIWGAITGMITASLTTALCFTTYVIIERNRRRAQGENMEMQ
jgi:hypothetical protein